MKLITKTDVAILGVGLTAYNALASLVHRLFNHGAGRTWADVVGTAVGIVFFYVLLNAFRSKES